MRREYKIVFSMLVMIMLAGCGKTPSDQNDMAAESQEAAKTEDHKEDLDETVTIVPAEGILELEDGLSAVMQEGDYGFDEFLSGGGAATDGEVVEFLMRNLPGSGNLDFDGDVFGCSTIAVQNSNGEALFGRNFDWDSCDAMIVISYPENDYASVSTVNMDFIRQGADGVAGLLQKADEVRKTAALYAPLDGMNEKGLAVSVNMIQDSTTIDQNTEKPDITTTTAVRLMLNKAATVDEAIRLLSQYDMHASMGMTVHFALADADKKSVVVEYINDEMVVTETLAVTNFYLSEGERYGIGSKQSHERYEILIKALEESVSIEETELRDLLDQVSKDNFGEFESTEWSIVFNLSAGKATYYHRENYQKGYTFILH